MINVVCYTNDRSDPHQQQLIGAAKSVKHPILSIPQGHPSPPVKEEPSPVLRHQHQDVQLDLQKVFPPVHYTPSRK